MVRERGGVREGERERERVRERERETHTHTHVCDEMSIDPYVFVSTPGSYEMGRHEMINNLSLLLSFHLTVKGSRDCSADGSLPTDEARHLRLRHSGLGAAGSTHEGGEVAGSSHPHATCTVIIIPRHTLNHQFPWKFPAWKNALESTQIQFCMLVFSLFSRTPP